jgi:integrase
LYSDQDIAALMAAARELRPLRAVTYETLIGLLAVTGMRTGEAIRLDRDDVDDDHSSLLVRDTKFEKSREVPVHQSTLGALHDYLRRRDELYPKPSSPSLFISTTGTRVSYKVVQPTFAMLCERAGLQPRSQRCRPRLHDLRHSLAVSTLLDWYRTDADVGALLPRLSTVLGHVDPASTYWYLEAAPELLGFAASRLEQAREALS